MTQQASTPDALIERLRARTAGPKCNADGTYTVGNCPPDALCREAAAEIERLRADAARYRWLLANYARGDGYTAIDAALNDGEADTQLSPAIDAAMRDGPNARLTCPQGRERKDDER